VGVGSCPWSLFSNVVEVFADLSCKNPTYLSFSHCPDLVLIFFVPLSAILSLGENLGVLTSTFFKFLVPWLLHVEVLIRFLVGGFLVSLDAASRSFALLAR